MTREPTVHMLMYLGRGTDKHMGDCGVMLYSVRRFTVKRKKCTCKNCLRRKGAG